VWETHIAHLLAVGCYILRTVSMVGKVTEARGLLRSAPVLWQPRILHVICCSLSSDGAKENVAKISSLVKKPVSRSRTAPVRYPAFRRIIDSDSHLPVFL